MGGQGARSRCRYARGLWWGLAPCRVVDLSRIGTWQGDYVQGACDFPVVLRHEEGALLDCPWNDSPTPKPEAVDSVVPIWMIATRVESRAEHFVLRTARGKLGCNQRFLIVGWPPRQQGGSLAGIGRARGEHYPRAVRLSTDVHYRRCCLPRSYPATVLPATIAVFQLVVGDGLVTTIMSVRAPQASHAVSFSPAACSSMRA
jgi:hypothetical protein